MRAPQQDSQASALVGTDDKARLKAARAVQDDAREVVENLHHEYWSLPAAKKVKILLFIVNILSERDDTVDLFKARLRELEMRLPGDEDDDWAGDDEEGDEDVE